MIPATLEPGVITSPSPAAEPCPSAPLLREVYEELRGLAAHYMRQERGEHTLQATALVHEVYLRLADKDRIQWRSRAHFVAVAATLMRRVLVDHARAVRAEKRGGRAARISLDAALAELPTSDVDLLALDDALARLARLDERKARVVELRFFGGLSVEQAAEVLGVSPRSVESDWSVARAFLRRELTEAAPDQDGVR